MVPKFSLSHLRRRRDSAASWRGKGRGEGKRRRVDSVRPVDSANSPICGCENLRHESEAFRRSRTRAGAVVGSHV
jgi:hypothetical protein